ncbi:MAG: ABC transporter ATP-binding protein [Sphaerochaeta sp.]|nr:ABC transporter ATP-binding protein [Sphaerochaeta sp.]
MSEYAIEMRGITKTFPGVVANDTVTLQVRSQEIHALLGENGAGKSTLMSILFGSYSADSGQIFLDGAEVFIKNPNVATALGIGMVHQHFKLVQNYSVTENIVLGMEPTKRRLLDLKSARAKVARLSEQYGLSVDPDALIEDISVGQQQRVEILKTLFRDAKIIIFDEPTAVLTPQEIDELMEILRKLRREGKTILLITHKLREIKEVADRCTVLRRGRYIGTVDVAGVTEQELAEMMVGRAVKFEIDKPDQQAGRVVLSLKGLEVTDSTGLTKVRDLSLDVHEGEIVGVAGVDGNGQSELLGAITGLLPLSQGSIILDGKNIERYTIRERIEAGLGYIPEDRQKFGLVADFTIAENSALKNYYHRRYTKRFGLLDFSAMDGEADSLIEQFDIRSAEGAATKAGSLSGGNQQKVIVAREISLSPKVLIVAQPTRGLDVGAIEYIRRRIIEERAKGRAILLVSFELDEIMNLCDRIATISKGQIIAVNRQDEVNEYQIGLMMAGSRAEAAQ